MVALVLAAYAVPTSVILDRRLADVLVNRARAELALAPRLVADRRAAGADALMMHAKELAYTPGLAGVMARGDSGEARALVTVARGGYADEAVLLSARHGRWSGPALPPAVVDETKRGAMPVTILADRRAVYSVAVAPVFHEGEWVGVAGLAVNLNQIEAERLAGLTGAQVLIVGADVVVASTIDQRDRALVNAVMQAPADSGVREIVVGDTRILVAVSSMGIAGRVVFVRSLDRELAVIPELRAIGALAAVGALLLALVLGIVLANAVVLPVQGLVRAADRLAAGDFDAPVRASRVGEVDRLATAFASMREALRARVRELEERQTRLTSLQAELIQRDRLAATGRLVAQLAHEIRNPVASIRNCLELIRRRQGPDPESTSYTDIALGELLRMHTMAEQLLDLHRPKSTVVPCCAPTAVAHEVAELLRIDTTEAPPTITVRGDREVTIPMAPDALKQVLLNLCHNAREAMAGVGQIEISIAERPLGVEIEVTDSGPGIPGSALPRIFDPFFTTKSAVHGVGLGLFVAEGLIRSHGGTISAANRERGPGARFVITLPRDVPTTSPASSRRDVSLGFVEAR